jgi:hypothetical protein
MTVAERRAQLLVRQLRLGRRALKRGQGNRGFAQFVPPSVLDLSLYDTLEGANERRQLFARFHLIMSGMNGAHASVGPASL